MSYLQLSFKLVHASLERFAKHENDDNAPIGVHVGHKCLC